MKSIRLTQRYKLLQKQGSFHNSAFLCTELVTDDSVAVSSKTMFGIEIYQFNTGI